MGTLCLRITRTISFFFFFLNLVMDIKLKNSIKVLIKSFVGFSLLFLKVP